MTIEELNELTKNIMTNASNQAELSVLLSTLTDDYTAMLSEREVEKTELEALKVDKEKLLDANMKLFLKVGHEKQPEESQKEETEHTKTLSYDDLFNEKGELK